MKRALLVMVLMPLMVLADTWTDPETGIRWAYVVEDGEAEVGIGGFSGVRAIPPSAQGEVLVPPFLGGYPVRGVGDFAFYACDGLTSVVIPDGVTRIGQGAFRDCKGLISVIIPSSVTSIGYEAFQMCGKMNSMTIPSNVTSIGAFAFYGCCSLGTVTVPSGVKRLGSATFAGCSGLASVTISEGVTSIDNDVFRDCSGLTSLVIPSSVTHIWDNAFQGCRGLADDDGFVIVNEILFDYYGTAPSVTIPSSVTNVGACAFFECLKLESVVIPANVMSVGEQAFYGCSDLSSVTICKGVTSIGGFAFYGCHALTSMTIPSSVTSIEDRAFGDCKLLQWVYYHGNAPSCRYSELGIYYGSSDTLVSYVREETTGWSSGASTRLPDSWNGRTIAYGDPPVVIDGIEWNYRVINDKAVIGSEDFRAVKRIVSGAVTIPSVINGYVVTKIGENAFAGLGDITSVVIPASVRTIESKAFADCDGLDTVTFLGDAPYVYDDAFSGTKSTLAFSVPQGSIGWSDTSLTGLPGAWKGHAIQYAGGGQDAGGSAASLGTVTVSNIVVHYVLNSVQPQFAISPSQDMGFVNIITEVKSTGVAAIPMSWAMNYPNFVSKFGSDFTAALGKPTGKIGTSGMPMLVWQDYVAGTDPTDEKDVFTASITIVDGKVTISYTPELDDARKAMRKYTTWGKTSLMDKNWTEVQDGHEAEYNFFKVSVEMR